MSISLGCCLTKFYLGKNKGKACSLTSGQRLIFPRNDDSLRFLRSAIIYNKEIEALFQLSHIKELMVKSVNRVDVFLKNCLPKTVGY